MPAGMETGTQVIGIIPLGGRKNRKKRYDSPIRCPLRLRPQGAGGLSDVGGTLVPCGWQIPFGGIMEQYLLQPSRY